MSEKINLNKEFLENQGKNDLHKIIVEIEDYLLWIKQEYFLCKFSSLEIENAHQITKNLKEYLESALKVLMMRLKKIREAEKRGK